MSSSRESESNSEEDDSNSAKHGPPGFSFSKSAIADLPSTAVQSIYIENETPVEVDDDVFIWRDTSPSGVKLPVKTKFKKHEWMKGKGEALVAPSQHPPVSTALKGAAPAVKANPAVHGQPVKQTTAPAAPGAPSSAPPPVKETRVASKNRLVKERASERKLVPATAVAVPKGAASRTKGAESVLRQGGKGSQTKVLTKQKSREKNTRREQQQQHHGKQGQHK